MKVAIVVGTRPEIIKMSPVMRALKDFYIIHTGQHYDYGMDAVFFEQLQLPQPKYNLKSGGCHPGNQLAITIGGVEEILEMEGADVVLVLGDTGSVLGGAIASSKCKIKVGHIEAGLRSGDRSMPEEINRILVDHCADYLFAPTLNACANLVNEGISVRSIVLVGNTIVDAVKQNIELVAKGIAHQPYFLVTLHRQENVDNPQRFLDIMKGLNLVSKKLNLICLYSIHPRAEKMMKQFSIAQGDVVLMPPRDYLSFLGLEKNAEIILTDSGGIQEEACVLKVPCVTLRDNTERPETVKVGANRVSGTIPQDILECATEALKSKREWDNPFGDGHTGERIVKILEERLG